MVRHRAAMSTPSFALTGEQKNAIHDAVDQPPLAPDFARTGPSNPHLRVFAVHFDGTQNDRLNVPEGYQNTLVGKSFEQLNNARDDNIASFYYRGVGTGPKGIRRLMESAFGVGCESNAEKAHADLVIQASAWLKEDRQAKIHVHVVGFSRGSATALHFLNLVDDRGAAREDRFIATMPESIMPGHVASSAVLFDTVSTGQGIHLNLTVPSSTVAVLHVTAGGEERMLFPLRVIAGDMNSERSFVSNAHLPGASIAPDGQLAYQRIQEVDLPGARHSDVGGSYMDGNIRESSVYLAETFQASLGLPVKPVKPSFQSIQEAVFHDSRFVRLSDDIEHRQRSERHVKEVTEPQRWDGRYVVQTRIDGAPMAQPVPVQYLQTGPDELDGRLERRMGVVYEAEFRLKTTDEAVPSWEDSFESLGLVCDTSHMMSFSQQDGRLMLHGKPVAGFQPLGDVHAALQLQQAQGLTPQSVKVSVDLMRLGAVCDTGQVPGLPAPPPILVRLDVWPEPLRECLRDLNVAGDLSASQASHIMNTAMRAVAEDLHVGSFDVHTVRIQPMPWVGRTQIGMKHLNMFQIGCERDDEPPFGTESLASGQEQAQLSARLFDLRRGLEHVGTALLKRGFTPGKGCDQMFEAGGAMPDPNKASMAVVDGKIHLNNDAHAPTFRGLSTLWLMGSTPGRDKLKASRAKGMAA